MVTAFGRPSFVRTAAVFVKLSFIRRAKSGVSVSRSNDFAMTMPFYAAAKSLKFQKLLGSCALARSILRYFEFYCNLLRLKVSAIGARHAVHQP